MPHLLGHTSGFQANTTRIGEPRVVVTRRFKSVESKAPTTDPKQKLRSSSTKAKVSNRNQREIVCDQKQIVSISQERTEDSALQSTENENRMAKQKPSSKTQVFPPTPTRSKKKGGTAARNTNKESMESAFPRDGDERKVRPTSTVPTNKIRQSTLNRRIESPDVALVDLMEVDASPANLRKDQQRQEGSIKNFRQAKGLANIYRCGKTEDLAGLLNVDKQKLSSAEKMLLYRAGLILDLRSSYEIKADKARKWTNEAPGGAVYVIEDDDPFNAVLSTKEKRILVNLDVLGPKGFAVYAEANWLTSAQEWFQLTYYKAVDGAKLHNMRVDALNKRGLAGLNEVILESGKSSLCQALKIITLHLEKKDCSVYRPIVIHCAQGKDRTGMLVMLLQSVIGVSDAEILGDYQASEAMLDFSKIDKTPRPGRLDKSKMKRATKQAMSETLSYIRNKYGSVSPGYLQAIGFDDAWRIRLMTALLLNMEQQSKMSRLFHL